MQFFTASFPCQSFPCFCNYQIVISIAISCPDTSYMYARIPSPFYQYVINLVVNLPIRRGPGVLMNVSVREHCAFNTSLFAVAEFTIQTPLSLLS